MAGHALSKRLVNVRMLVWELTSKVFLEWLSLYPAFLKLVFNSYTKFENSAASALLVYWTVSIGTFLFCQNVPRSSSITVLDRTPEPFCKPVPGH